MNLMPASATDAFPVLRPYSRFVATHLWIPLAAVLALSALLTAGGVDQWLATQIYHAEGGHWLLKDHWFTAKLVHRGGKQASTAAALALLVFGLYARHSPRWNAWSRPALYVVLAVGLSTAAVSLLKGVTHMDCPWDLASYGGTHAFYGLFESRQGVPASGCFPAGHASGGYAWVALYFAALAVRPRWRKAGLAIGLGAGLLFGVSQQLRGAHFLSHDLWALAVCWGVSLGLYLWLLRPRARSAAAGAAGETA
ncbi:phosphatase PAP2 family protein [[Pseudomonas] boreopolis]|uniref:phosphatase PAP2 family protein n=1 Tax=Xanthomonas boreopolis TaxID=86183 RepID=UPI003DA0C12A